MDRQGQLVGLRCPLPLRNHRPTALGYPLTYDQALRIVEIALPVFLGYLGAASIFVLAPAARATHSRRKIGQLPALLLRGPLFAFCLASLAALVGFGLSNRQGAAPGIGMSIDTLALILSSALGLLTVSTHAMVAYLFTAGGSRP